MVKVDSKVKDNLMLCPLPKIDDLYMKLSGTKIFSALDLTSGYYHIELGKDSHAKTTFVTPFGKWEFNMVPFDLAQAPPYFQALISMVLEGLGHFSIAHLGDIIIFSKNKEEHLQHLEIIFKRLHEAGFKLKRSKYSFMKMHIEYLGHLISEKGHITDARQAIRYQGDASTQKLQRNQTVFRTCRILSKVHTKVFRHSQTIN